MIELSLPFTWHNARHAKFRGCRPKSRWMHHNATTNPLSASSSTYVITQLDRPTLSRCKEMNAKCSDTAASDRPNPIKAHAQELAFRSKKKLQHLDLRFTTLAPSGPASVSPNRNAVRPFMACICLFQRLLRWTTTKQLFVNQYWLTVSKRSCGADNPCRCLCGTYYTMTNTGHWVGGARRSASAFGYCAL